MDLNELHSSYMSGVAMSDVAKANNLTYTVLYNKFRSAGLLTNRPGNHNVYKPRIAAELKLVIRSEFFEAGMTRSSIAKRHGISPSAVAHVLGRPKQQNKLSTSAARHNPVTKEYCCCVCDAWKPYNDFYKSGTGHTSECKQCHLDRKREQRYGVSVAQYAAMLTEQRGVCAVCSSAPASARNATKTSLCVDHDHSTGKVRGLLCNSCNSALGKARDNTELLLNLCKYLGLPRLPLVARSRRSTRTMPKGSVYDVHTNQYRCAQCENWLDKESFYLDARNTGKRTCYCKECLSHLRRLNKYGVTVDQYNYMLAAQGNVCAVCSSPPEALGRGKTLVVDHDHKTHEVRGILCNSCNHTIGLAEDSALLLTKMANYLLTSLTD